MSDVTPPSTRLLRIIAAVAGLLSALAASEAAAVGMKTDPPSFGALAAACAAALAAAACIWLVVAPVSQWRRAAAPWSALRDALQRPPTRATRSEAIGLVLCGSAGFLLIVLRLMTAGQNPWDDDQGAFLITAGEIRDRGGLTWLWTALWSGEFPEANRHPLYLALLSLQPTVRGGQLLSLFLGVVTLGALTAATARRCGGLAAGLFCVLLGTNGAMCLFSTRVVCDVLMVLWGGLIVLLHLPPARQTTGKPSPLPETEAGRHPWLRDTVSGGLLGLAWLTKGTGLVLFATYLLWIVAASGVWRKQAVVRDVIGRWRALRLTALRIICAAAAFALVGLPLLARNVNRFGSPFHNINSLLLFADRYEDLAEMQQRRLSVGEAAREYVDRHSAGDILRREASGVVWEAFIIVRSLGPAPLDDARLLIGLPWALLAAALLAARREPADGLLAVWVGVSWLVFAWYVPIAAGERFVLPLLAPLLAAASDALSRLASRFGPSAVRRVWWLAAGWVAVWALASWFSTGYAERNG